MKNKKNPAEFLGAKVLSPIDQDKLKGSALNGIYSAQVNFYGDKLF